MGTGATALGVVGCVWVLGRFGRVAVGGQTSIMGRRVVPSHGSSYCKGCVCVTISLPNQRGSKNWNKGALVGWCEEHKERGDAIYLKGAGFGKE